jgi:hypothetical protein
MSDDTRQVIHLAWAAAFAFVGLCAAIAYYNVHAPAARDPQTVCFEQRGKWAGGWSTRGSTCEFPSTAAK